MTKATPFPVAILCLASLALLGAAALVQPTHDRDCSPAVPNDRDSGHEKRTKMTVEYLEIVTPSVAETCEALANAHGVTFSEPIAALGGARTTDLASGGRIGVRAPLRETETPVVRPYVLVDDIESAVKAAEAAGATIAMPPMQLPGQGTFSIRILGGIEHGLWQR